MRYVPPHYGRSVVAAAGFACMLLANAAAEQTQEATVVILVRHAEKASTPIDDPPLSPAGQKRAAELARIIGHSGVRAIFTSEAVRTQETVRPLAEAAKIEPVQVAAADVNGLADRIRTQHQGRTVLVAGHSNTVPRIIAALGGPEIGNIPDAEYDNLLILFVSKEGPSRLLRLKFLVTG